MKDPKAHMLSQHPDGIALSTSFMQRSLLATAEAEVEEACASGGAVDLYSCFTVTLSPEDLGCVVQTSTAIATTLSSGRGVRLGEEANFIVSATLIESCGAPVGELAAAMAKERAAKPTSAAAAAKEEEEEGGKKGGKAKGGKKGKKGNKGDDDDDDDDDGGKRGKKGKDWREAALGGVDLDDDDDDDGGGRGKKGKKGKDKKKGGGGGGGEAAAGGGGGGGDGGGGGGGDEAIAGRLEEALVKALPQLDETAELAGALAAHLLPKLLQMVAKAVEELKASGVADRRKAVQAAQERLSRARRAIEPRVLPSPPTIGAVCHRPPPWGRLGEIGEIGGDGGGAAPAAGTLASAAIKHCIPNLAPPSNWHICIP